MNKNLISSVSLTTHSESKCFGLMIVDFYKKKNRDYVYNIIEYRLSVGNHDCKIKKSQYSMAEIDSSEKLTGKKLKRYSIELVIDTSETYRKMKRFIDNLDLMYYNGNLVI